MYIHNLRGRIFFIYERILMQVPRMGRNCLPEGSDNIIVTEKIVFGGITNFVGGDSPSIMTLYSK